MAKPETSADLGYDTERVEQAVLALLFLTAFREGDMHRAWKGHDWDTLNRLHAKGYISDPVSKAKSVVLSEEGYRQAQALFLKLFASGGA
jgi:hypothetical protein